MGKKRVAPALSRLPPVSPQARVNAFQGVAGAGGAVIAGGENRGERRPGRDDGMAQRGGEGEAVAGGTSDRPGGASGRDRHAGGAVLGLVETMKPPGARTIETTRSERAISAFSAEQAERRTRRTSDDLPDRGNILPSLSSSRGRPRDSKNSRRSDGGKFCKHGRTKRPLSP